MLIFKIGETRIYLRTFGIRIYRFVNSGKLRVTDYYWNPLKTYRKRIEVEVTKKHLQILKCQEKKDFSNIPV